MSKQRLLDHISESAWLRELSEIRQEILAPGYWATLEENCAQWAKDISVCPFWSEASKQLSLWIGEYRRKTREALLLQPGLPNFEGKKADRIRSKLYQKRLRDKDFKYEVFPEDGPPVPKLNDLVRTRISCLFIDGVEFLANELFQLAETMKLNPQRSREGRLEGYFAQHVDFMGDVFYRFGGGSQPAHITCEIQVATELSTRIWDATHPIYESAREEEEPADWQWNPKDPRFVSRQLGHMIHLADGLLVQLREAVVSREKTRRS